MSGDSNVLIPLETVYSKVFGTRARSNGKYTLSGISISAATAETTDAVISQVETVLRSQHGLYREETSAVTFLTPTLFRTGIPLPGEVPIGTYDVEIKLFSDGALVTKTDTAFEIVKVDDLDAAVGAHGDVQVQIHVTDLAAIKRRRRGDVAVPEGE